MWKLSSHTEIIENLRKKPAKKWVEIRKVEKKYVKVELIYGAGIIEIHFILLYNRI